jgi:transposase InsO family protein
MEAEWELDRVRLFQLMRDQPGWSIARLAAAIGRCQTWVKKWRRRFREAKHKGLAMFKSHSRAPHSRIKSITPRIRNVILCLRDQLKEVYHRVVGPKTILYHLHQDTSLQPDYLPRSPCTIWRVLKEGGRIPTRVKIHYPIERPAPMTHWEMDFGQMADRVEFLTVVDRGTSILVNTQAQPHYNTESVLLAVTELLLTNGLPDRLRFDRDSRFLSSWGMDGYPSPLLRFLWCLGIEPDPTPPRRPDLKPFVERCIRTLKYECLWIHRPQTPGQAAQLLDEYRYFYNHDRANQATACRNQPPYVAYPILPTRPTLPEDVDPDAWLPHYDRLVFKRHLGTSGMMTVDSHLYYVGNQYRGERVQVHLDASRRCFHVIHKGNTIQQLPVKGLYGQRLRFSDYLNAILEESRSVDRQLQLTNRL